MRARFARNCSPFESTWKGFTQDGGEERPTLESKPVISLACMVAGKPSTRALSSGQGQPLTSRSPKNSRAMVDLPEPLGPMISPICQGLSQVEVDDPFAFRLLGGAKIENALNLDDARRAADAALTVMSRSPVFRVGPNCETHFDARC